MQNCWTLKLPVEIGVECVIIYLIKFDNYGGNMQFSTQQIKILKQLINGYIVDIIQMYIAATSNIEEFKQQENALRILLESLLSNDVRHRFWTHPPIGTQVSYEDRCFYNLWSLIHRPEKVAKELGWINKDLNIQSLPMEADEGQLLREIQQITSKECLGAFQRLFSIYSTREIEHGSTSDSWADSDEEDDDKATSSASEGKELTFT